MLSSLLAQLQLFTATWAPLLAQVEEEADEGRNYQLSVVIVLLSVGLGLLAALRPSKRTVDFKKPEID